MVSNKVIFLKYPADILHKYFTKLQAITGGKLMKDKILKYFFSLRDTGQQQQSPQGNLTLFSESDTKGQYV